MRVLIDECVDERLRHEFSDHDCQTSRFAGFAGLKNGHLLSAAEKTGFEVIVTVDQSIPYQQDLQNRSIALLVLRAPTNRLLHLKQLISAALKALTEIKPSEVITISCVLKSAAHRKQGFLPLRNMSLVPSVTCPKAPLFNNGPSRVPVG